MSTQNDPATLMDEALEKWQDASTDLINLMLTLGVPTANCGMTIGTSDGAQLKIRQVIIITSLDRADELRYETREVQKKFIDGDMEEYRIIEDGTSTESLP